MLRRRIVQQRLVAAFVAACLLLTYPLLSLFDRLEFVAGIPVFYAYACAVWVGLIAVVALIVERRR
jgi:hypothetical protein